MRDLPNAEALLLQARKTLLEQLLPALPEARRYEALMVASAMAMAAREIAAEDRQTIEAEALANIMPGEPSMKALVLAIRAGAWDGDAATGFRCVIVQPFVLVQSLGVDDRPGPSAR